MPFFKRLSPPAAGPIAASDARSADAQIRQIGEELLAIARKHPDAKGLNDKLADWAMRDDAFKVQLFRFVDTFPMLPDAESVHRHLTEYLGEPPAPGMGAPQLPPGMGLGLKAGGLLKGTMSRTLAGQITAMGQRYIAGTDAASAVPLLRERWKQGVGFSVDLLGEACLSEREAEDYRARYHDLIGATRDLPPIRTAVVHPCDPLSLSGALEAAEKELIVPILVGPRAKIQAAAEEAGRSLDGLEIVDTPHSDAAAEAAVAMAREAKVEALMKGKLHTDELMAAVVDPAHGIRTERRMSHIYGLDVPTYPKPLLVTDAAINIYPSLDDKRDIVQNAIDLAHTLAITKPKVALLSAVETVTPKISSTVEAAALCKMAERGQITGGLVDGPLAFDNAISRQAAETKGIVSEVAGDADILVAPDLEAGNMIAKQLIYLAGAEAAGVVLGARVPIMLTSRADSMLSRLASAALVRLFVRGAPQASA